MTKTRLFAGFAAMAFTVSMTAGAWAVAPSRESGSLPSLDAAILGNAPNANAGMTPVSDMTGHSAMADDDVPAVRMQLTPWSALNDAQNNASDNATPAQPAAADDKKKQLTNAFAMEAITAPASALPSLTAPSLSPMVAPAMTPQPAALDSQTQNQTQNQTQLQTPAPEATQSSGQPAEPQAQPMMAAKHRPGAVQYTPLSAVAIFPVVRHGGESAFGDLPVLFSREFSMKFETKTPGTKVYNPVYTVDELRARGLGHIYDQVMDYYRTAGRPEPAALDYLVAQLNTGSDTPIARVVFVDADLDANHPTANTGLWEHVKGALVDGLPEHQKYFVRTRVQVFNAEDPAYPMIWAYSASRPVSADDTYNVTASVFTNSDSEMSFARVSRDLSGEVLGAMPKAIYLEPHIDTGVSGQVLSQNVSQGATQGGLLQRVNTMTQSNRNTLHRILNINHD